MDFQHINGDASGIAKSSLLLWSGVTLMVAFLVQRIILRRWKEDKTGGDDRRQTSRLLREQFVGIPDGTDIQETVQCDRP